jgi:hypothetical protein
MTTAQSLPRKRPALVWVISILTFLEIAWTLLTFYVVWSGKVLLTPEAQSYFDRLTPVSYAICFGGAAFSLLAAVALLMLRKIAVPLFVIVLALSLASLTWEVSTNGWADAVDGTGLVVTALLSGLEVAACLYAWHLARRGVLR